MLLHYLTPPSPDLGESGITLTMPTWLQPRNAGVTEQKIGKTSARLRAAGYIDFA